MFDGSKKTIDPFIGDRGGFSTLLVNPAGSAKQSGFEFSMSSGAVSTREDLRIMSEQLRDSLTKSGHELSIEDLLKYVDEERYEELLDSESFDQHLKVLTTILGQDLENGDADSLEEILCKLSDKDWEDIQDSIDGMLEDADAGLFFKNPKVEALASLKIGFLMNGFGLGVYNNFVGIFFLDPLRQTVGIAPFYSELGLLAGGGVALFDGKVQLGFSANYGILLNSTEAIFLDDYFDSILNADANRDYNWGLDVGVLLSPVPSLGIGLVFHDILGSIDSVAPRDVADMLGIQDSLYEPSDYYFPDLIDTDIGFSWQPDWKGFRPKFSLDLYNIVDCFRNAQSIMENEDDAEKAFSHSLEHVRVGASITLFEFLKLGMQYYDHFFSCGLGIDIRFFELYGEVKVHDGIVESHDDVLQGMELMLRLYF